MLCRPTAGIRRLLEMQADSEQDQRPEHHGKHRREHGREAGQMREVVVRVRDDHADNQIDDHENIANHAALLETGPRSRVEPESLVFASAIRHMGDSRRLPLPSASLRQATAGAHERLLTSPLQWSIFYDSAKAGSCVSAGGAKSLSENPGQTIVSGAGGSS